MINEIADAVQTQQAVLTAHDLLVRAIRDAMEQEKERMKGARRW